MSTQTTAEKEKRLNALIAKRKQCDMCNSLQSKIKMFNSVSDEAIGQWTKWNGNLNAEYMIIGQDWGTKEYLEDFRKWQKDNDNLPYESYNTTNKNLAACIKKLNSEWDILKADGIENNDRYPLYFTNEILCYKYVDETDDKKTKMNASIPSVCYKECTKRYLLEQIEIVTPKVIVLLGFNTFKNFIKAAGKDRFNCTIDLNVNFQDILSDVLNEKLNIFYTTSNGDKVRVFPMWHTGGLGARNAKIAYEKENKDFDGSALEVLEIQWRKMAEIVAKMK